MASSSDSGLPYQLTENRYRITVVVALFVTQILTYGLAYCIGIFQHVFLEVFEQSSGITSWVSSLNQAVAGSAGKVCIFLKYVNFHLASLV